MFSKAGATAVKASIERSVIQGLKGMILSPIQEVFQEIIEDGFIEALSENLIDLAGGTDDLGFWISSFMTSRRETTGALGQLARGDASIKTTISLIKARMSGDGKTFTEISNRIEQNLKQKQEAEEAKLAQMSFWDKMIKTGFLKGVFMVMPSILFGSFSFVALSGVKKMMKNTVELSPVVYGIVRTEVQARRRGELNRLVGTRDVFSPNLQEQLKKPADLEAAKPDINEKYRATQETEKANQPLTAFLSSLNYNPKTESKKSLASKFNEIRSSNYFESTAQFDDSQPSDDDVQTSRIQVVEKKAETSDLEMSISIGDDFEGLFPEHNKDTINYIHSKLFDPEYDQNKPKDVLRQINYRCSLISEARQILKSTKYYGLDIIIDEIINPYVLAILQDKFNKGEKFTKLERIIADVASFYMGGPQIRHDAGYDHNTIKEYEEETGKKAFLSNSPTKSFTDWFKARQARDVMLEKVDGLVKTVVDDYMESLDRNKLQFRQLRFQDYVSDPSDVDKIYNNRKKYCWTGVVYRITELKEENGKIVEGRKLYGFTMNDLESRWENYKKQALDVNKENQRIHNAILEISEKIDGDIDDWFKREVIEVHWDTNSIRDRERHWIKKDNTQDLVVGFNKLPGGEGGPKIHISIRLLAEYIAMGLKVSEIKIELENHGIFVSIGTVHNRINERYGSFIESRKIFLKPVIKQLITEGYKRQDISEECFKTETKNFLRALLPKLFGENYKVLRKRYLLEMVSTILETGSQVLTYGKIQSFLPLFGKREIINLIGGKWGGILNAKLQFGREIAIYLFRKEASVEHILRVLGYSEGTIKNIENIDRTFKKLFDGMTADEAREHFTSGYKDIENHFIWYSDLDNY